LLLERPTDDSIEIAVGFSREVGAFLTENAPKANATVFERFRAVLNEGSISHRVQYMIEVLMQVRKDKYKDNPILPEGLDLVEEDEQITHQIQLEDDLQVQEGLSKLTISSITTQTHLLAQTSSKLTPSIWRTRRNTRQSKPRSLEKIRTRSLVLSRVRKKRKRRLMKKVIGPPLAAHYSHEPT
jgi:hypothetical protein